MPNRLRNRSSGNNPAFGKAGILVEPLDRVRQAAAGEEFNLAEMATCPLPRVPPSKRFGFSTLCLVVRPCRFLPSLGARETDAATLSHHAAPFYRFVVTNSPVFD